MLEEDRAFELLIGTTCYDVLSLEGNSCPAHYPARYDEPSYAYSANREDILSHEDYAEPMRGPRFEIDKWKAIWDKWNQWNQLDME